MQVLRVLKVVLKSAKCQTQHRRKAILLDAFTHKQTDGDRTRRMWTDATRNYALFYGTEKLVRVIREQREAKCWKLLAVMMRWENGESVIWIERLNGFFVLIWGCWSTDWRKTRRKKRRRIVIRFDERPSQRTRHVCCSLSLFTVYLRFTMYL